MEDFPAASDDEDSAGDQSFAHRLVDCGIERRRAREGFLCKGAGCREDHECNECGDQTLPDARVSESVVMTNSAVITDAAVISEWALTNECRSPGRDRQGAFHSSFLAMLSSSFAKSTSFCVMPPASCVVKSTATRL